MSWLWYALFTTVAWGVWGAISELPTDDGFPSTLSYVVWSITMIPCALVALSQRRWKLELSRQAIVQGCLVGFLGAGGQLVLFEALRNIPAYIAFPIVSLYPVLTVLLSTTLLKERASRRQWIGVAIALPAIGLLSYAPPQHKPEDAPLATNNATALMDVVSEPLQEPGIAAAGVESSNKAAAKFDRKWLWLAVIVFVAWGLQAYFMKTATQIMSAEGLFVYMTISALLCVPIAIAMTTITSPIEWSPLAGWKSPWIVALIQILNAAGALTLVHAMRKGKAMIVAPLTSLAPVITILLSLAIYGTKPSPAQISGLVLATVAIYLFAE